MSNPKQMSFQIRLCRMVKAPGVSKTNRKRLYLVSEITKLRGRFRSQKFVGGRISSITVVIPLIIMIEQQLWTFCYLIALYTRGPRY